MPVAPRLARVAARPPRRVRSSLCSVVLAVTLTVSLTTAGCSLLGDTPAAPGTAGGQPTLTLRVGVIPTASCAPFYLALQRGYFQQEGLTVEPVSTTNGAQAIQELGSSVDVTLSNDVTAITAQMRHSADLRFVFTGAEATPLTYTVDALQGSGITKLADLVGKTVGVNAVDDIVTLSLDALLKANDIPPAAVHYVVIHYEQSMAALTRHQVDAAVQSEPYITETERQLGARPVVDVFASGTANAGMPQSVYVTTAHYVHDHARAIAAFQRAMRRGADDATTHYGRAARDILPSYTRVDRQIVTQMTLPTWPDTIIATHLQRVVHLMFQFAPDQLVPPGQVSTTEPQIASLIVPVPAS